jgi:hypothetical protein
MSEIEVLKKRVQELEKELARISLHDRCTQKAYDKLLRK